MPPKMELKVFYIVDRLGALHAGKSIDLLKFNCPSQPHLQRVIDEYFPLGVSYHGKRYAAGLEKDNTSYGSEVVFELIRRQEFPELPSRYVSVFAWDNMRDAESFYKANKVKCPKIQIIEAEASNYFRANMKLATFGPSLALNVWSAREYWRGNSGGKEELWEYLLPLPVSVKRIVMTPTTTGD